ncbi:flagellar protein FlaG [Pseudomonas sp. CC6-YY-74]|uniref:flagellar protein FlaG n=1 Tax=Pseudomonas sp. CC6-YY-74 TaxID=1930532 RepID=UPI0009A1E044|nr:flagellar protein FlaG [Pseudomonas sp. CC6-YY-74]
MDIAKLSSLSLPAAQGLREAARGDRPDASAKLDTAMAKQADNEPLARERLDSAVASISSFVQGVQRSLDFSIDESSGEVVVKVTDRDSGEVIRQLPSEEALRLSEQLESLRSLMFETRA